MKYKNIDSAIHNFGHSFMSSTNYFDDGHVVDEIKKFVRKEPHEIWINFSTGEIKPADANSPRLQKAIAFYQSWLGEHLPKHNIDMNSLENITLHHRLTTRGSRTTVLAVDDRGVEHTVLVRSNA